MPWLLLTAPSLGCGDRPAPEPPAAIEGRVLLPDGDGPRGVEVRVQVGEHTRWERLDPDGRFVITPPGWPARLAVMSAGQEVLTRDLEVGGDVGVLDVSDLLRTWRLALESPEAGVVRANVWAGEIPRGPMGSLPSLGSAQFPEQTLPAEVEWLLPVDAGHFTLLVEWPGSERRGRAWETGTQRTSGPYTWDALPQALCIDAASLTGVCQTPTR